MKKEKKELKDEINVLKKDIDKLRKQYNDYFYYALKIKELNDTIAMIKRIGGTKSYVLETWWDWMRRSRITKHDFLMFFKKKRLKQLEDACEKLEEERFQIILGKKPNKYDLDEIFERKKPKQK